MTFNEKIAALKAKMNDRMTKDTPKEELDFIADVNKELDSLQEMNTTLQKEKTDIQEMYIGAIRKTGSSEKPKEETEQKPRTLEEIGAELKAQEDKKK